MIHSINNKKHICYFVGDVASTVIMNNMKYYDKAPLSEIVMNTEKQLLF